MAGPYLVDGELLGYKFQVTQASAEVGSNLTRFAGMFDLSNAPAGFWTHAKPDAGDVRVTLSDGTTRVAVEIKYFVAGSSLGILYFDTTSLSSGADTDFIVYYGNPALSQPGAWTIYGAHSVYNSDFAFVHHYNEDSSGGAPQVDDSTGNGYNGTVVGITTDVRTDTDVGQGYDLNGVDEWVKTDSGGVTTDLGAISAFFKVKQNDVNDTWIWAFQDDPSDNNDRAVLYWENFNDTWRFANNAEALGNQASISDSFLANEYKHIACQWDNNDVTQERRIFLDGVEGTSSTLPVTATIGAGTDLEMGMNWFSSVSYEGNIVLDETRVYNAAQTADWYAAEASNFIDVTTFFPTVGAEEGTGLGNGGNDALFFGGGL